jgi:hypothetical protein
MNSHRRFAGSTLLILIPLCCNVVGVAYGVGLPDAPKPAAEPKSVTLDLRVPELRYVMSRSELLADMGPNGDEDSIEVVAAPPLVPLSFDFEAPLGIVDSVHWSVDHPTQAWRILLPATVGP